jgi:hypothetical protein
MAIMSMQDFLENPVDFNRLEEIAFPQASKWRTMPRWLISRATSLKNTVSDWMGFWELISRNTWVPQFSCTCWHRHALSPKRTDRLAISKTAAAVF